MKLRPTRRPHTRSLTTLALALLLAGAGYLTPRVSLTTAHAHSAALPPDSQPVGDFDGDGKLDYAYTTGYDESDPRGEGVAVRFGKGDGMFTLPFNFPVGSGPMSPRKGDFNGDGKLDLAVLYNNGGDAPPQARGLRLALLLNRGDGNFDSRRETQISPNPGGGLEVGDFNGDGKLDLVVSQGVNLYALLGQGDGNFSVGPGIRAGGSSGIWTMTAADVSGDGKLDLVVGTGEGVGVLAGKGDGTFAPQRLYATPGGRRAVVGDVNGDGKLDVAVVGESGSVSLLFNQGDGTFGSRREYGTFSAFHHLALADLNGDGKLDVVVSGRVIINEKRESKWVIAALAGGCHGALGPQVELSEASSGKSMFVADFNRDGKPDIVIAREEGTVLLGPDAGPGPGDCPPAAANPVVTFAAPVSFQIPGGLAGYVTGDFNRDGKLDLATTHGEDPKGISLFFGQGDGTFSEWSFARRVPTPVAGGLMTGDVNNDGKLDLLTGEVWLGNGDGTFTKAAGASFEASVFRTLADLNGDGKLDLAGGHAVRLGAGDGTFAPEVKLPYGNGDHVAVGDFNGDTKADLLRINYTEGSYTLLVGRGDGTFAAFREDATSRLPITEPTGVRWPTALAAGDLNGDGKLDFVVSHNISGVIAVFTGRGDGTFDRRLMLAEIAGTLTGMRLADFNNDGKTDLAANISTGHFIVLPGLGDGTFGANTILDFGGWPLTGDFNGDGRLDVALPGAGDCQLCGGKMHVLLNTSTSAAVAPTPTPQVTPTPQPTPKPTPVFFGIAGHVKDEFGQGVNGLTVTLTGAKSATVKTRGPGYFDFLDLPAGGGYTVTVRDESGTYTLSPATRVIPALVGSEVVSVVAQPAHTAVAVSAASYTTSLVARESIITVFGSRLATGTASAAALPLPATLAGTRVKVVDRRGYERDAPLFFASPTQINCQVPPGVEPGEVFVKVLSADGTVTFSRAEVAHVAPAVFSADASGRGVAAATLTRVKANGEQTDEPAVKFDPAQYRLVPVPIDLGPEGEEVYLILYGTGWRFRSDPANVTARVGGREVPVYYAGFQPGFVGLDQANILLPRALQGAGEVEVALVVDGKVTNKVQVKIK